MNRVLGAFSYFLAKFSFLLGETEPIVFVFLPISDRRPKVTKPVQKLGHV